MDVEKVPDTLTVVQSFYDRFEAEIKPINCQELAGLDLTIQEGMING